MNRKWAEGIQPQKLLEVVSGLFVCEQIGGFDDKYRKVRRDVEIAWVKQQDFDLIVSLLPTPQNLQNYKNSELNCVHFPVSNSIKGESLIELSELLQSELAEGKKILMHRHRRTDFMAGILAGFILSSGRAPNEPEAILKMENLQRKKLGNEGRQLVKFVAEALATASTTK